MLVNLIQGFYRDWGTRLATADYIYADSRVPHVSLYDHLLLTAAFAVAFTRELLQRGYTPRDVCGIALPPEELIALVRLCGLLHDIGKVRDGGTEYRGHVQRGVEYAREWLSQRGLGQQNALYPLIVEAIARHHLDDGPRSPLEKVVCLADSYAAASDRPELAKARTVEELARVTAPTVALEKSLFGTQPPVCLLLGDVDAIKTYVYEAKGLPDIRGGSQILQDAEEAVKGLFGQGLSEECLIYCGGGGLLALVPASQADEWRQKVQSLYLARTKAATITVVASSPLGYVDISRGLRPYDEERVKSLQGSGVAEDLLFSHFGREKEWGKRKNFGELVAYLTGRLQQEKRCKVWGPFWEAFPVHQRCQACGKRAAEGQDTTKEPPEWLCGICREKRDAGRQERRKVLEEFQGWLQQKGGIEKLGQMPQDLDSLAGPEGRIALIYADGNNVGDLLQRAPSPAAYRHLSQALSVAIQEALFQALRDTFKDTDFTKGPLPFEIIAVGGDDVVVMVRAGVAWALTVNLLHEFERHEKIQKLMRESPSTRLSLSAGVAIADVKYPVRFLLNLAEGLLKEAKRLARDTKEGALCHLWLRAPVISERAADLLQEVYERQDKSITLTARPYTLEQARRVLHEAQRFSSIPASLRHSLAEALEKGPSVSLNYALYEAARMERYGAVLQQGFVQLGKIIEPSVKTDEGLWFWRRWKKGSKDVWCTALLDVLELVELHAHTYSISMEQSKEQAHE